MRVGTGVCVGALVVRNYVAPDAIPALSQLTAVTTGIWLNTEAMEHDSSSKKKEKNPVGVFEQGCEQVPPPVTGVKESIGTFYCKNGNHLVDSVVWLEQLALGCKPCMIKLRADLTKDTPDVKMRLWSVEEKGIKQVPTDDAKPLGRLTAPTAAKTPPKPRTPPQKIWVCTKCNAKYGQMDGFLNTKLGFVCKACAGTHKFGRNQTTGLQREAAERRQQEVDSDSISAAILKRLYETVGSQAAVVGTPEHKIVMAAAEAIKKVEAQKLQVECIDCGKRVIPVEGWNPNLHEARCGDCWRDRSQAEQIKALKAMGADPLQDAKAVIIRDKDSLPKIGIEGELRYCHMDHEMYRWFDGQWVRVALPARRPKDPPSKEGITFGTLGTRRVY